jgi:phenylpropionate dioxygenase-like ring-hydroxylating dioxygenase large terminal subunit
MLSHADNELLCRVGPGTAMGAVFRRFWTPICLADQLAAPDGDPLRLEVFGEQLVAFRDTEGRLGLLDEGCPHRGVSLALGRNEEGGLRCLLHGWKFAVDGTILETPICPNLGLRDRLKARSYPVREAGGLIWAYLGAADKMPAFPHWPFFDVPVSNMRISRVDCDVNYMQQLESGADSAHVAILHANVARPDWLTGEIVAGARAETDSAVALATNDLVPTLLVEDTDFGFHYAAVRKLDSAENGRRNIRIASIIMPSARIIPSPTVQFVAFEVPINDTRTASIAISFRPDGLPVDQERLNERSGLLNAAMFCPLTRRYLGTWENRFGQDRRRLKETWTGISGVGMEDMAMSVSQGAIADRSKEHLVPTDQAIVRARRQLLDSARRMAAGGEPIGVHADVSRIQAIDATVAGDVRWQDLVPHHKAAA